MPYSSPPPTPHPLQLWHFITGVLALLLAAYVFDTNQKQRAEDQNKQTLEEIRKQAEFAAQKEEREPRLVYDCQGQLDPDNTYVYTFTNKSPVFAAVITQIDFIIFDPALLAKIEKVHPRPKATDANISGPTCGNEGYFYTGCWHDNHYHFASIGETIVPQGGAARVRFRIVNKDYNEQWLKGELVLHYNSKHSPLRVKNVSIIASRSVGNLSAIPER